MQIRGFADRLDSFRRQRKGKFRLSRFRISVSPTVGVSLSLSLRSFGVGQESVCVPRQTVCEHVVFKRRCAIIRSRQDELSDLTAMQTSDQVEVLHGLGQPLPYGVHLGKTSTGSSYCSTTRDRISGVSHCGMDSNHRLLPAP